MQVGKTTIKLIRETDRRLFASDREQMDDSVVKSPLLKNALPQHKRLCLTSLFRLERRRAILPTQSVTQAFPRVNLKVLEKMPH
jgi:hypothetical protein